MGTVISAGLILVVLEVRAGNAIAEHAKETCVRHTGDATITEVNPHGRPFLLTRNDDQRGIVYLIGTTTEGDELMTIVSNYDTNDCGSARVEWILRDRFSYPGFRPKLGPLGQYTEQLQFTNERNQPVVVTLVPTVDGRRLGVEVTNVETDGEAVSADTLPVDLAARLRTVSVTLPEPARSPTEVLMIVTETTISFSAESDQRS